MLDSDTKKSIWDEHDHCGIKRPHPSGGCEPGRGGRGSCGGRGGRNGDGRSSAKDRDIDVLKKQLTEKSLRSINDVNARKEDDVYISTEFAQSDKKRSIDCLLLCVSETTSWRDILPQIATAPVTCSRHRATVPHSPPHGDNAPWVPIEQSGENFEVYGYQENQDPPEILERVTYAAVYDIPNRGTIILACHNLLGGRNHRNVSLVYGNYRVVTVISLR